MTMIPKVGERYTKRGFCFLIQGIWQGDVLLCRWREADIKRNPGGADGKLLRVSLADWEKEMADANCEPVPSCRPDTVVSFAEVDDEDRTKFLTHYQVSRSESEPKMIEEATESLAVSPREVWAFLTYNQQLGDVAEIHRGIEWNKFDEQLCYSASPQPGFSKGYARVDQAVQAFVPPAPIYLNLEKSNLRGGAWKYPWRSPKVFVNAVRTSRSGWRHAAFLDYEGLIASQNFHGVWPKPDSGFGIEVLASILNSPLAAAYIITRENGKHNHVRTLASMPLPILNEQTRTHLIGLVRQYLDLVAQFPSRPDEIKSVLSEIDNVVAVGYGLPPTLEESVAQLLSGHQRPVPVPFTVEVRARSDQAKEEEERQLREWESLKRSIDEDRASKRKLFS